MPMLLEWPITFESDCLMESIVSCADLKQLCSCFHLGNVLMRVQNGDDAVKSTMMDMWLLKYWLSIVSVVLFRTWLSSWIEVT